MDKKYWILGGAILGLIIFGILLLTSCNKNPKASELNFVTFSDEAENLADYIANFETQNNTKINITKLNRENYELESLNLLSTGKVDIWGMPNSWIPKQHSKLAPYAGKMTTASYESLYPKIIAQENIINNKIYGLPLSFDALVLFENSDLKAGKQNLTEEEQEIFSAKINNWDDLAAKSRLLVQKSGQNIIQSGAALGTENIDAVSDILTVLMLQYGTQMTDEAHTKATFHTSINFFGGESYPGAAALDLFVSFGQSDHKNYSFSQSLGDPEKAFADGKVGLYLNYSAKEKDFKRLNPKLNFEIKSLPQVKATENPVNFISYETFTVPSTSNNQILAWEFLAGLTNKENLQTYFEKSDRQPVLSEYVSSNEGEVVNDAIATARSWYNPEPTEVDKILRDAILQVVSGQKAQTALDGAAVQVTSLLEKIKE